MMVSETKDWASPAPFRNPFNLLYAGGFPGYNIRAPHEMLPTSLLTVPLKIWGLRLEVHTRL